MNADDVLDLIDETLSDPLAAWTARNLNLTIT